MRILFISPWLPSIAGGSQTRTYHLIKELSKRHAISLISFVQPHERALLPAIQSYCEDLTLVPFDGFNPPGKWQNRIQGWMRLLFNDQPHLARIYPTRKMHMPIREFTAATQFDLVQIESLIMAETRAFLPQIPTVLNTHNAEHVVMERTQQSVDNLIHRIRDRIALAKLAIFERKWVQRFDACLAVSSQDADLLMGMTQSTPIYVTPNGVDCEYFASNTSLNLSKQYDIVFVGTMHYPPNVDGILYFCREIWPIIRERLPNASLTVVGSRPTSEVLALGDLPGVVVTGYVDDIRSYFWQSKVSVVPLRIGGGTRLKILESLAAGCPVVSTTVGAEGLELSDGTDFFLADLPREFAERTLQLLADSSLRDTLAQQGRTSVGDQYDWVSIATRLETVYKDILDEYCGPKS